MTEQRKNFNIPATKSTPEVRICASQSHISIKGRSITEDASKFYHPVIDWIEKHGAETNNITLNLYLEYLNSDSKRILSVIFANTYELKKNNAKSSINVHWQYDNDDDDMKVVGEVLQQKFNINFSLEPIGISKNMQ